MPGQGSVTTWPNTRPSTCSLLHSSYLGTEIVRLDFSRCGAETSAIWPNRLTSLSVASPPAVLSKPKHLQGDSIALHRRRRRFPRL